jgi:hypothetical protein
LVLWRTNCALCTTLGLRSGFTVAGQLPNFKEFQNLIVLRTGGIYLFETLMSRGIVLVTKRRIF